MIATTMSETPRYWILDAANKENRLDEISAACNQPMDALVDEEAGGIIAYVHTTVADSLVEKLNTAS